MKQSALLMGLVACMLPLLVSCGEDGASSPGKDNGDSSSSATNNPTEYRLLEDAGVCAPSRYGEVVFVLTEGELYFCSGKKWVVLDDGEEEDEGRSSVKSSSENGEQQTVSSGDGSSKGGDSSIGASSAESSEKQTTSSSQKEGYVPHKPDILQWGANYTTVTINDTVVFTLMMLTDANGVEDIKFYDWDFGDGVTLRKADSGQTRHAYTGVGSYTVSVTAIDSQGDSTRKSLIVTVIRGEPSVSAGGAKACYNSSPCFFGGNANDPNSGAANGSGRINIREWDYEGDGTFDESRQAGDMADFVHTFPDTNASAHYAAIYCAVDDDENRVCDTVDVAVSNRAPVLEGTIGIAGTTTVEFSSDFLTLSDPDNNQLDSLWWDLDNDGIFETAKGWAERVTLEINETTVRYAVSVQGRDRWGAASNSISVNLSHKTLLFDRAAEWQGAGTMDATGSYYDDPSSAEAVLAQSDTSYKANCKLMSYVNPSGWGYVYAGLIYVLDGATLANASPLDIGEGITIKVKAAAGKSLGIYAYDKTYYSAGEGVPTYRFIATGNWQVIHVPANMFKPWAGATNVFNPANVYAIAVAYEYFAVLPGETCAQCGNTSLVLEWQKLAANGYVIETDPNDDPYADYVPITAEPQFKIVGYAQNGTVNTAWSDAYMAKMTHVIVFGPEVDANGNIVWKGTSKDDLKMWGYLGSKTDTRIMVAFGGANKSANFSAIAYSGTAQTNFLNQLAELKNYHVYGIDIDREDGWPYPPSGTDQLLAAIAEKIHPLGMKLSVATGSTSNGLGSTGWEAVDWVNVMCYDFNGNSSSCPGSCMNSYSAHKSKAVIGVPFYTGGDNSAYATGHTNDLVSLNGVATATNSIKNNGYPGIMFWNVSHDKTDASTSLLYKIAETAGYNP